MLVNEKLILKERFDQKIVKFWGSKIGNLKNLFIEFQQQ